MNNENTETTLPVSDPDVDEAPAVSAADRLAELEAEKAELQDRILRRQAEFENFRRRADRERSEFLQYAGMEIVRDILPVVDDFERALKVQGGGDTNYRKGVELIYQRLLDSLTKVGLEPMDAAGKIFDPNVHQAVDRVKTKEVEDQTILEEYQRGYNFKGKLLRPAMVKVATRA